MLAISFFEWWYSRGWAIYFEGFFAKLRGTADTFSIGLLLKTLFQPFRQISANASKEEGGQTAFAAFTDRFVSRLVGAIARLCIIVAGIIIMVLMFVGGLILGLLWPLIPLMPVVGAVVSVVWGIFW